MMISVFALVLFLATIDHTHGFAYAPNFITKTIVEQTGIKPVGLLEIEEVATSDNNGQQQVAEVTEASLKSEEELDLSSTSVTTRFPPEPNGYLHLGHAKAISFNFAVARIFGGKCHMRLDDTNPSKEGQEYVDSILEDVRWIQSGLFENDESNKDQNEQEDEVNSSSECPKPWFGKVRHTSDYFDLIYDCAVELIKNGDAYVDSLTAEEMKEYRGTLTEPGKESPHRNRSIDENLDLFSKMKAGEFEDGKHILRAKIDMASPNLNMRDPALFRIKHESHQSTGDTWCVYPMYDFSHPISDAVEGITHSLCTLEFADHRPLYDWTVEKLMKPGFLSTRPQQIEFSRLNIKSTVLSKRKLIQLVEQGHVNGWDDPRMPTLSGMRRRGVPPSAIRLFCERIGISKQDSNIDYKVLEDCMREEMDASCKRAFCILNPLKVTLTNWDGSSIEDFDVPRHPKIKEMGDRTVPFGKQLYIERSDFFDLNGPEGEATGNKPPKGFKRLLPGEKVRLKYAYVISCDDVIRDPDTKEPVELKCTVYPETRAGVTPEGMKRVKGIIQWVEASTGVKCQVNQYDRLFRTEEPGKESGDYIEDINKNSLEVLTGVYVEPSVAIDAAAIMAEIRSQNEEADKNETKIYHSELAYQFERSGYFALDPSSTGIDKLVFNRVTTLRDTWGADTEKKAKQKSSKGKNAEVKDAKKSAKGNSDGAVLEDIRRVALRAATILEVGPHPEADNLLVCKVDCGDVTDSNEPEEPRTVVAGLAGKIAVEDLVGRKVVAVTNLKPARMRGIESTAMLLAASDGKEGDDEKVELLDVPESVPNGELISFEGKEQSEPDAMMKSKGALKAWGRAQEGLKANDNGEATYNDGNNSHRMMTSGGPIKTTSIVNANIQ